MTTPTGDLVKQLRDHENEGITGSDRFHLRNEAADLLEVQERDIEILSTNGDKFLKEKHAVEAELQEARELLTTGLEYLECVTHYDMRAPLFAKQNDAKWVKTVDAFLSRRGTG